MNTKFINQIDQSAREKTNEKGGNSTHIKGIEQLSRLIHDRMGLHFGDNKNRELIQGIACAGKNLKFNNTESFINFLLNNEWPQEILDAIALELTIGETYFLRDKKMFDILEQCIIPENMVDKKLKFWSAACSTGEEPYSIAIVLDRAIPDIKNWDIKILASDINKYALQKAQKGVYRPWSFRETNFPNKNYYFKKNDSGSFEINENIKKMVKFFNLNLISEKYPSILNGTTNCDIIFCRNVLIYFSLNTVKKVIEQLYHCLTPGGLLILSATELPLVPENLFELVNLCGNLVLQKPIDTMAIPNSPKFKLNKNRNNRINFNFPEKINNQNKRIRKPEEKTKKINENTAIKASDNGQTRLFATDEKYKEAELLADKGKYKEALQMCKEAIDEAPLQVKWNYLYSVVLFESNELIDAAKAISKVLYLDTDNVMGHIMSGHINNALGKKRISKKSFDNALMLLNNLNNDDVVNGSGGESVKRLKATIEAVYGRL